MNAVGFLLLIQVCFGQRFDLDGGDGLVRQRLVVNSSVTHIEQDLINEAELIYSDASKLRFTADNLTYGADYTGYVEGSPEEARFKFLFGFLQLNKSIIILVDKGNGCLRQLNRNSNLTKQFSGICANGTYNNPHSIIRDTLDKNRLIFTANSSLGYIDLTRPESPVSFVEDYLHLSLARGIVQDTNTGYLYITVSTYTELVRMEYPESTFTYLGIDDRSKTGELIFIARHLLLITHITTNKLTVFDLESNRTIRSICGKQGTNVDRKFTDCRIRDPTSLVIIGNSLLIGALGQISEIQGRSVTTENEAAGQSSAIIPVFLGIVSVLVVIAVLYLYYIEKTAAPPNAVGPTAAAPTFIAPTAVVPNSVDPTAADPTAAVPTAAAPTSVAPTAVVPNSVDPTDADPTAAVPTAAAPTSVAPTSVVPNAAAPTSVAPTSVVPNAVAPTSVAPTSVVPNAVAPTSVAPTAVVPTAVAPTSADPTAVPAPLENQETLPNKKPRRKRRKVHGSGEAEK